MGFALNTLLVFHPTTLQLYDTIVLRGAAFATPVQDEQLPPVWILSHLSSLEMETILYNISWFKNIPSQQLIKQLGLPHEILDDPFALDDHVLVAILSLMGTLGMWMEC